MKMVHNWLINILSYLSYLILSYLILSSTSTLKIPIVTHRISSMTGTGQRFIIFNCLLYNLYSKNDTSGGRHFTFPRDVDNNMAAKLFSS